MTARIDLAEGAGGTSIRVAGWLDEATARELLDLCSRRRGVLIIDLSGLVSADRPAVETLQGLRDAGACIVGASPYITMLLAQGLEGPAPATDSDKEEE
jgi:anti-anti-sigma regulatory factor